MDTRLPAGKGRESNRIVVGLFYFSVHPWQKIQTEILHKYHHSNLKFPKSLYLCLNEWLWLNNSKISMRT